MLSQSDRACVIQRLPFLSCRCAEASFFGMKDWRCVEEKKVREPKSDAPHSLDVWGRRFSKHSVSVLRISTWMDSGSSSRVTPEKSRERGQMAARPKREMCCVRLSASSRPSRESREASTELSKKNTYTDGPSGRMSTSGFTKEKRRNRIGNI